MIRKAIHKLVENKNLDFETTKEIMDEITSRNATQAQISSFLTALRMKGETIDEIAACTTVTRDKVVRLPPPFPVMGIVGTGGSEVGIFNISTTSASVVAVGGVWVVKYGNRSISGRSGAVDMSERLRVGLALAAQRAETILEDIGMCFSFAPAYHSFTKYAAPVRGEIGIRGIFNILGLLFSPAGASTQLLGTYNRDLVEPLAQVLANLGVTRGVMICGGDGLNKTTFTGPTYMCRVRYGKTTACDVTPEELGLAVRSLEELIGDISEEGARITRNILSGSLKGLREDVVVLNVAVSLYLGIDSCMVGDCIRTAQDIIDSEVAMAKMEEFIQAAKKAAGEVKVS